MALQTVDDRSWLKYFKNREFGQCVGTFDNIPLLEECIREFSYSTKTNYVVTKSNRFGKCDFFDGKKRNISFNLSRTTSKLQSFHSDGIPFVIGSSRLMECHQGPKRRKKDAADKAPEMDHIYSKKQSRNLGSKKTGCRAAIHCYELLLFPQYKIGADTEYERKRASRLLKEDFHNKTKEEFVAERIFVLSLPELGEHSNHNMDEAADIKAPIDDRVLDKVDSLVNEGVTNTGEMKRHIQMFVKTLFKDKILPKYTNRRFYPSRSDLRSLIYRSKRRLMNGLIDQDALEVEIEKWKQEYPESSVFFRQYKPYNVEFDDDEDDSNGLLLVYQTKWQKRLLLKYGNAIAFMDATYKTTKYALPLFFICVKTNVGYSVVAQFVVQSEKSESIAEALAKIKEFNPLWHPQSFMIDSSESEMKALSSIFPDSSLFVCDFHRKQAWQRWTAKLSNGVAHVKEELMTLMNVVAESLTEEEFIENLDKLKSDDVWTENSKLQQYFEKQWLDNSSYKRWVWAFRNPKQQIVVTTNNGIEAQNKVFKYDYITPHRSKTLTGLMRVLINDFLPDTWRRYVTENVTASAGWRLNHETVPPEMHHRPQFLINHIRMSYQKSSEITSDMICSNYKLIGTVVHRGRNASNGHYLALVHHLNQWWCCDDAKVTECEIDSFPCLEKNWYYALYERQSDE